MSLRYLIRSLLQCSCKSTLRRLYNRLLPLRTSFGLLRHFNFVSFSSTNTSSSALTSKSSFGINYVTSPAAAL